MYFDRIECEKGLHGIYTIDKSGFVIGNIRRIDHAYADMYNVLFRTLDNQEITHFMKFDKYNEIGIKSVVFNHTGKVKISFKADERRYITMDHETPGQVDINKWHIRYVNRIFQVLKMKEDGMSDNHIRLACRLFGVKIPDSYILRNDMRLYISNSFYKKYMFAMQILQGE